MENEPSKKSFSHIRILKLFENMIIRLIFESRREACENRENFTLRNFIVSIVYLI